MENGNCGIWKMESVENGNCGKWKLWKWKLWKMEIVKNGNYGKWKLWKMEKRLSFENILYKRIDEM